MSGEIYSLTHSVIHHTHLFIHAMAERERETRSAAAHPLGREEGGNRWRLSKGKPRRESGPGNSCNRGRRRAVYLGSSSLSN